MPLCPECKDDAEVWSRDIEGGRIEQALKRFRAWVIPRFFSPEDPDPPDECDECSRCGVSVA